MTVLITIFKIHFQVIYFFLKLLPTNMKKIVLITRQNNNKTLDFILIEEEINKKYPDYKVVSLTKKLEKNLLSVISYYFHMYKQMYHLATSHSCIVDTYIIPVSILKHKKHLKIVQLCHGIGNIKKFAYQTLDKESGKGEKLSKLMKMHHNYDYVISTSPETSKFYSEAFNIDISKTVEFGPPWTDYVLKIKDKKAEVFKQYPGLDEKPVIFYFATFRTYKDDFLDKFIESMNTDKYNIIIYLHFVMYKHHPELVEKMNNIKGIYLCKDSSAVELLSIANYVITDYSSTVFESAILDIPTYLYVPDYDKYVEKNGLNVDIFKELPGYVYKDAKDLFTSIELEDYNYEILRNFRKKYVVNISGNSTEKLVDLIINGGKNE